MVIFSNFLFLIVLIGVVIYDLVPDMETVFGLCKQRTAYGNYDRNLSDAQKLQIAVLRASLILQSRCQDNVSSIT